MGTARTVSCDAFTLTVDDPQRGDRELQIDLVFAPGGPTDDATIELVVRGLPREERLSPGTLRGLLRRDRPVAEFSAGPEGTVDVRVRNTREATGGRVTLAACEWSRSDGASTVYDPPIATAAAPLGWQGPGMVGGRLVLPPATAAPAAIETRISGTAQGIHWLARFEIDEAEDSTFRDEVTLHVGVDRPE